MIPEKSAANDSGPGITPGPCEDDMEIGCQSGFRSFGENNVMQKGRPAGWIASKDVSENDVRLCAAMML